VSLPLVTCYKVGIQLNDERMPRYFCSTSGVCFPHR
jgi:hypothetical protein